MTVIPLWVKKLTAFAWLLVCAYGIGYLLGRIVPSTLCEFLLFDTLLAVGVCLGVLPLVLMWSSSSSPKSLVYEAHPVSCAAVSNAAWETFLRGHKELKKLAAMPQAIERLYTPDPSA